MIRTLPYLLLGPVTGPLVAGVARHHRTAPVLASLYALAAVLWWLEAPAVLHALVVYDLGVLR